MKFKTLPLALGSVLLAACTTQAQQPLQQSDLLHRHFVLQSVDGKVITGAKTRMEPGIEFGEKCMFLERCVTALWVKAS